MTTETAPEPETDEANKAARAQIVREELGALRERLVNANRELADRATLDGTAPGESIRLHGKAEGVRLALSYVDEALRTAQPAEEAAP